MVNLGTEGKTICLHWQLRLCSQDEHCLETAKQLGLVSTHSDSVAVTNRFITMD